MAAINAAGISSLSPVPLKYPSRLLVSHGASVRDEVRASMTQRLFGNYAVHKSTRLGALGAVAQYVDDDAAWIGDKEPPNSPRFVGERVYNLAALRYSLPVNLVNVCDFNT